MELCLIRGQRAYLASREALTEVSMAGSSIPACRVPAILGKFAHCAVVLMLVLIAKPLRGQDQSTAPQTAQQPAPDKRASELPRGRKLILKDGTYQIIREYERNGDRVRYFSEERGEWEEIPASMVDWDATAKDAAAAEKASAGMVEKIHRQEEAKRLDNVTDIDASLQVGDGVFLPSGEGLFVVEGKSIRLLQQAGSRNKTDTLRTIEQIMSPVPIVPGKQTIVIAGAHATLRLHTNTPEFYLREAPPDPDRVSPIMKSSRPGESGPDLVLIRAKVVHNGRQLESISSLFGQVTSKNRDEVSVQRWEVAPSVYRFTLSSELTPGEYVLAEVLEDGLNYFVWDFGLDGSGGSSKNK